MFDDLGNRMKIYENVSNNKLMRRCPVIIRIDGKSFHTFTRGFRKPFDSIMMECMWETTQELCKQIQGCKIGYTQSDEISLLLIDYDTLTTDAWFDNNIQKIVSISASIATLAFNKAFKEHVQMFGYVANTQKQANYFDKYESRFDTALFDSRAYNVPREDVCNYFIWRQQDATRNSILSVGQANFSHKELMGQSCNMIQEMLYQDKEINFNALPTYEKRGVCVTRQQVDINGTQRNKWLIDKDIPIFTQDREYIEKFLYVDK